MSTTRGAGPLGLAQAHQILMKLVLRGERFDRGQDTPALRVGLIGEPVIDPVAVAARCHDPSGLQDTHLPRRVGLREIERALDVADAELAVSQKRDDANARLVAERTE